MNEYSKEPDEWIESETELKTTVQILGRQLMYEGEFEKYHDIHSPRELDTNCVYLPIVTVVRKFQD
jgi:hypothetical protein